MSLYDTSSTILFALFLNHKESIVLSIIPLARAESSLVALPASEHGKDPFLCALADKSLELEDVLSEVIATVH